MLDPGGEAFCGGGVAVDDVAGDAQKVVLCPRAPAQRRLQRRLARSMIACIFAMT
jgi:hypothetical protein